MSLGTRNMGSHSYLTASEKLIEEVKFSVFSKKTGISKNLKEKNLECCVEPALKTPQVKITLSTFFSHAFCASDRAQITLSNLFGQNEPTF